MGRSGQQEVELADLRATVKLGDEVVPLHPQPTQTECLREAGQGLDGRRGLDLRAFRREFAGDAASILRSRLVALQAAELVAVTPERHLKLTPAGRRIADSVLLELL